MRDGNTKAFYDYLTLSTITKDGAERMAVWADRFGSGRDLLQATPAEKPLLTADGVLFNGTDEFMQTLTFPFVQPEMIYIVFNQITRTLFDYIFDGFTDVGGGLSQRGASPKLECVNGALSGENGNLQLDTLGIVRVLFNGASSTFQINETTVIEWAGGGNDMDGFTLANRGSLADGESNILVKGVLLRSVVDNATEQQTIYDFLNKYYSVGL